MPSGDADWQRRSRAYEQGIGAFLAGTALSNETIIDMNAALVGVRRKGQLEGLLKRIPDYLIVTREGPRNYSVRAVEVKLGNPEDGISQACRGTTARVLGAFLTSPEMLGALPTPYATYNLQQGVIISASLPEKESRIRQPPACITEGVSTMHVPEPEAVKYLEMAPLRYSRKAVLLG